MKNKLTLVSITFNGRRFSVFVMASYDEQHNAVIDTAALESLLDRAGVRRGDTYTMG